MCDPDQLLTHYGWVLDALGQPFDVLPDGTMHTVRDGLHFLLGNSAAEPEYLLIDCPAPAGDPAVTAEAIEQTQVPHTITLHNQQDHVVARAELQLAAPGDLPDTLLLADILPGLFDRLADTVYLYVTELTLAGIKQATADAARAQPELWA